MYTIKSFARHDDDLPFSIAKQDDKLTAIGICDLRRKKWPDCYHYVVDAAGNYIF